MAPEPLWARPQPEHLPQYDLTILLDTHQARAEIREVITWKNTTSRPTSEMVLNFYPHYRIPEGDYLLLAKTLELLRLNPRDGIDRNGRHGVIDQVRYQGKNQQQHADGAILSYSFQHDNPSGIIVELPEEVGPGESVTIEIECTITLPNKQGRWGHWEGVTYLANALPVLAYYDDTGWHSMPFIPWHQPFWNEAGIYTATITLPADEVLACAARIQSEKTTPSGWREIVTEPFLGRDFTLVCSREYQEHQVVAVMPDGRKVLVKCYAKPKHEYYGREIATMVSEALPVYEEWFGPYPYDQLVIAESFFGWNGNECAGLILIDERVFQMPKLARGYVEYLVSHETCHQWWYNLVGTNGYSETFVDEGAATYFTHRMLDRKHGPKNTYLDWPDGLKWMPNIQRDNYRYASMYGAIRRGEMRAAAGELPGFDHLVGLFTGAYDRGSKVYGMIEARLGEEAFMDFTQMIVANYSWKMLSASNLRAELEAYTGQDWGEFFERWVYGKGMTDWEVHEVRVHPLSAVAVRTPLNGNDRPRRSVEVVVRQTAEFEEPTQLGIELTEGDGYAIRVPIGMAAAAVSDPNGLYRVECEGPGIYRVHLMLPSEPTQLKIDPDIVLLDSNPGNNVWKSYPRVSVSPVYSMLNETDLTNDYDRWNIGAGPWIGGALYPDPWYTRSTMIGARAGAYRTQIFNGGVYTAIRSDYRDWIVGADALWDHYPSHRTQLGLNVEQRIAGPFVGQNGRETATRAAGFARYVFQYGSSLYLPPIHYAELFTTYQDNFLPYARERARGAQRPQWSWMNGIHYRLNLYTPYWDPECGVWLDLVYGAGVAQLRSNETMHQFRAEIATAKKLPDWQILGPLSDTRFAIRGVTMAATPDQGQFFALGGGNLFRGFDLAERQGSMLWAANAELRIPVARRVRWDALDHTVGVRNLWFAAFYDVGEVFVNGRSVRGVAHALGGGLRVDMALFSFIERATLRFDAAKALNTGTPVQFWFGVQHPF